MSHAASRGAGSDMGAMVRRAIFDSFAKLDPRVEVKNPRHVPRVGERRRDHPARRGGPRRLSGLPGRRPVRDRHRGHPVVHGALRQTSRRPSPRGAARPRPTPCAPRRRTSTRTRSSPPRTRTTSSVVPSASLVKGDLVIVRAGEQIPGDGEVVEGRRLGGRVGHHRRVGPRHPRGRRRPLGRDRRHHRGSPTGSSSASPPRRGRASSTR